MSCRLNPSTKFERNCESRIRSNGLGCGRRARQLSEPFFQVLAPFRSRASRQIHNEAILIIEFTLHGHDLGAVTLTRLRVGLLLHLDDQQVVVVVSAVVQNHIWNDQLLTPASASCAQKRTRPMVRPLPAITMKRESHRRRPSTLREQHS